jgi:hypothetical protein
MEIESIYGVIKKCVAPFLDLKNRLFERFYQRCPCVVTNLNKKTRKIIIFENLSITSLHQVRLAKLSPNLKHSLLRPYAELLIKSTK